MIKSLEHRNNPGIDDVRLVDRFYLGEPQMRGFDIRGIGPRVLRKFAADSSNPYGTGTCDTTQAVSATNCNLIVGTDRKQFVDDALGGRFYYQGRAELEIPLGSGAKELGIRPSIFMDVGAVWGVKRPVSDPNSAKGYFFPQRDANGNPQFGQIDSATLTTNTDGTTTCNIASSSTVTSPTNTITLACLPVGATAGRNTALGNSYPAFIEQFVGNTWKPRLSIGIGFNWNSPFGPFRLDFAKTLLRRDGDATKTFTFNVGTQF